MIFLSVILALVHVAGMYVIFIKISNTFDPNKLKMTLRHQTRLKRIHPHSSILNICTKSSIFINKISRNIALNIKK